MRKFIEKIGVALLSAVAVAVVCAGAWFGQAQRAEAATAGGFPSTPRLRGLFIANTRVYPTLWAVKTTTESRANTVTIADDAELTINVEASKYYYVTAVMKFCGTTSGTMGVRFRWVATGGLDLASQVQQLNYVVGVGATVFQQPMADSADATIGTISVCNTLDTYVRTGTILTNSAGVLKLQWAQSTTSANNLNMFRGSYISALKLN